DQTQTKADVAIRPCVATILQKGRRRANIPQRKSLPLPTPTSLSAQLRCLIEQCLFLRLDLRLLGV
ncbi:MAG: hypothetical protein ACKVOJ_06170, partial [Sphingomonadaceae bacterium]